MIVQLCFRSSTLHGSGGVDHAIGIITAALLVRSRRYFQISANKLLAADKRDPVLLLRSFEDDEQSPFNDFIDFSIETRLVNHFSRFGPVVAVGSPLEAIPTIGAARIKLADDEWQNAVIGWMQTSSVIVMLAGKTPWVSWELGKIFEGQHLEKFLLLIPINWKLVGEPARG